MVFQDLIFWVLAVGSVAAALGVVVVRDIFRAALLLVVVFLAVAGLFAMMNAEFLAVVQVLIYAGAIAILIIFAIMLTRDVQMGNLPNRLQPAAVVLPAILLAAFVYVAVDTDWPAIASQNAPVSVEAASQQEFVEDQALRRAADALRASTVAGLPGDWQDDVERRLQSQIDEATAMAEESRLAGNQEEADRLELEADLLERQRTYLERGRLVTTLDAEFVGEFERVEESAEPTEQLLTSLSDSEVETDKIATIIPKVEDGKWWLANLDGNLRYSVVAIAGGLEVYEGRLERAEERSSIGDLLINDFVLPFEMASVLLLAAIIGALVLVRER